MTSTRQRIKGIGIVGAGRVSRDHAFAAKCLPEVQLIGVADPDEEKRLQFARGYHCEAYADSRDLFAHEDVDVILAGIPHGLHAPVAIDAFNAGKHVMVEKPMAMTIEECQAMIDAAAQNDVQLMVGHTQHFFPANLATKKQIQDGRIGEIVLATVEWYKPFGLSSRPSWLLNRATGGGMWLMNGAHMIDLLLWFVDSPPVAVKGSVTNKIVRQNADDSIIALIEFANGVHATVVHSGSKRPDVGPPEQWLTSVVTGTEGQIKTIPYECRAWANTAGEEHPILIDRDIEQEQAVMEFLNGQAGLPADTPVAQSVIEQTSGVANEVRAFIKAIEVGITPPVSNRHAMLVMEVILAVEESSRTGREVRLQNVNAL